MTELEKISELLAAIQDLTGQRIGQSIINAVGFDAEELHRMDDIRLVKMLRYYLMDVKKSMGEMPDSGGVTWDCRGHEFVVIGSAFVCYWCNFEEPRK